MIPSDKWKKVGWRYPVWELVRYYCSLRGSQQQEWVAILVATGQLITSDRKILQVDKADAELLKEYLEDRRRLLDEAFALLRTEALALQFCKTLGINPGTTQTKSQDHHQSSKALTATVAEIAIRICLQKEMQLNPDPQTRCVWCVESGIHVTARNLDGAIPALANPRIIWEVKEYWGHTKGGSKMSDALYECNLVGRELREFEERTKISVTHVVFLDGLAQWQSRKSDLARFIDLLNQGLVDYLFVGKEVETNWKNLLLTLL